MKKIPGGIEKVQEVLKLNKIDALIALGGDDTQSVTLFLSENGVPSVGVPKTIDNDISGTDADLRLRHRRIDCHRGRRQDSHHCRLPQSRHRG